MKTPDEDKRLLKSQGELEGLREKSTFEVGPISWNREELYEDRIPPAFKSSDPNCTEKKR
jgi:hypothetical protein